MSQSIEPIKSQAVVRLNVEFQLKHEDQKNEQPLLDVFEIMLNHINISELVKSGDG